MVDGPAMLDDQGVYVPCQMPPRAESRHGEFDTFRISCVLLVELPAQGQHPISTAPGKMDDFFEQIFLVPNQTDEVSQKFLRLSDKSC